MDEKYKVVYEANGYLDAESMRIFLESAGFDVLVNQESAGSPSVFSFTFGAMGTAYVLVKNEQYDNAVALIKAMQEGKLEKDENLVQKAKDDTEQNPPS